MPTQTNNRTASQRTRKGIAARGAKQVSVRKRRQVTAPAAAPVANSIFALKAEAKKGAQVYFAQRGHEDISHKDAVSLYTDLYASYENLYTQMTDQETRDVYKLGIDLPVAFDHILNSMKSLLPSGYDFNIEFDEHCSAVQKYYFVIYHPCGNWPMQWNVLEVGQALLKLAKSNPPLHDLFISFLRAFRKSCANLWNEGLMGATLEYIIEDRKYQYEQEDDEEEYGQAIKSLASAINDYKKGTPAKYRKLINKAPLISAEEMQKRAARFRNDGEIANLIYQGCELLKSGLTLHSYRYDPDVPEDGYDFFLDLDDQCNIIWNFDDGLCIEHREMLDNEAANGYVQEPVWSKAIFADTKVDFSDYTEQIKWPGRLVQYFTRADELLEKYKK